MFVESLKSFELWALKSEFTNINHLMYLTIRFSVHDASGKLSSGVLNGNVNQFGDFDQCLSVKVPDNNLQGQYCLTYLQPRESQSLKYTNYLRQLLQSHDAFKSSFDDVSFKL